MSLRVPEGFAAIITAAGRGSRAGGKLPKQWQDLAGRPVLTHAIAAFSGFRQIVLVIHAEDMDRAITHVGGLVTIITGADTRSNSVMAGLEALEGQASHVLIHDGARPLISQTVIQAVIDALEAGAIAAAPAIPVADTLWQGADGIVTDIAPRDGLFRAQTPQGFRLPEIIAAHRASPAGATDDVALALAAGHRVAMTAGDEDNIKITWPGDLARAEKLMGA